MVTTAMAVVLLDLVRFKRAAGGRAPGARPDCRAATPRQRQVIADRTAIASGASADPPVEPEISLVRGRFPDSRAGPKLAGRFPDNRADPEFRSRRRFAVRSRIRRAIGQASRLRAREVDPLQRTVRQVYPLLARPPFAKVRSAD